MKQKSAEEILAASRPSDIFTMDFSVIESEKEEYLSRFKPEAYNTVRNFVIAQKVILLYRQAIRILNGEEENLSLVKTNQKPKRRREENGKFHRSVGKYCFSENWALHYR